MAPRNREFVVQRPYPVDGRGFPLQPWEVDGLPYDAPGTTPEKVINQHRCYMARTFAANAISQTFRDLEFSQTPMIEWQEKELHRRYYGINLPPTRNMMDKIEEEKHHGGKLKTYNLETRQYDIKPITDEIWKELNRIYGRS